MKKNKRGNGSRTSEATSNGSFLKDLDHLIEEIEGKLSATSSARALLERDVRAITGGIGKSVTQAVEAALPDLEARTVALLKRNYPGFITSELEREIGKARTVKAPFMTWLVGEGKSFRIKEKNRVLGQVKVKLRGWIETNRPASVYSRDALAMDARHTSKSEEVRKLSQLEQELTEQLEGLQRARRIYGASNAPTLDPEFRSAVSRSSTTLRNDYDRSRTDDTFWRDIYISNSMLESIREQRRLDELNHQHDHRHVDDDTPTWNRPRSDDSSSWSRPMRDDSDDRPIGRSYPSSREDRGGGMEINVGDRGREDRGSGFQVDLGGRGNTDRGGGMEVSMRGGNDDSNGRLS